jgi:hypothetical protein
MPVQGGAVAVSARKITRIIGFPEFFSAVMGDDPEIGSLRLAGCTLAQERDVVRVLVAFRDQKLARAMRFCKQDT